MSSQLVEQNTEGQCNSECKTIERTCQEVCLGLELSVHLPLLLQQLDLSTESGKIRDEKLCSL